MALLGGRVMLGYEKKIQNFCEDLKDLVLF